MELHISLKILNQMLLEGFNDPLILRGFIYRKDDKFVQEEHDTIKLLSLPQALAKLKKFCAENKNIPYPEDDDDFGSNVFAVVLEYEKD
jgi:hypothetical protein